MSGRRAILVAATIAACGDDDGRGGAPTQGATTGTGTTTTCCEPSAVATSTAGPATAASSTTSSTGGSNGCACSEPTVLGTIASAEIDEASGIAASRTHPGVYYVHNDSGDTARFFAIDESGALLATYRLVGAKAVDWEDMAAGPCASGVGNCLYFGDFGDNDEQRSDYRIFRVTEPATLEPGIHDVAFETQPFAYPDGSHNAETLLVHPTTGEIAIVQKKMGTVGVYTAPAPTFAAPIVLEAAGTLALPGILDLATGGDVRADGTVVLRTYLNLYRFSPGASLEATLSGVPCALPVAVESQGEAVAWSSDGLRYVTLSEGMGESLHASTCER